MPFSSPLLPDEHLWEADGTDNPEYISWVLVEKLPSCWFFGTVPCGIRGWWETQMLPENSWRGNSPGVSGGPWKAAAAVGFYFSHLHQHIFQLLFHGVHGHMLQLSVPSAAPCLLARSQHQRLREQLWWGPQDQPPLLATHFPLPLLSQPVAVPKSSLVQTWRHYLGTVMTSSLQFRCSSAPITAEAGSSQSGPHEKELGWA